jgi:hypothetical protein
MHNNFMKLQAAVVLALLAISSTTLADINCLTAAEATDTNDNGYAVAVQGDQGQGSIDCSVFEGFNGPMHPVTAILLEGGVGNTGTIGTVDDPLHWSVTDPDPNVHVDIAYILNSGDGQKCIITMANNSRAGNAGAGLKTNKDSTFVACADDYSTPQPAPTPTPPLATDQNNDCATNPDTAGFQTLIDNNPLFHGLILFGPGIEEGNSGLCTSKNLGDGKLKRCVNRCIKPGTTPNVAYNTPFYDDPGSYQVCTGDGPFYPIECRACELHTDVVADPNSPNTEFCWEQIQKAELTSTHFPNGSYKKAPGSKGEQVWGIDRKHGSDCYLINGRTASGWPYSYWFPSDCPK